jgi:uncharacterized protein YceK
MKNFILIVLVVLLSGCAKLESRITTVEAADGKVVCKISAGKQEQVKMVFSDKSSCEVDRTGRASWFEDVMKVYMLKEINDD